MAIWKAVGFAATVLIAAGGIAPASASASTKNVTPQNVCVTGSLELWQDINQEGYSICFSAPGTYNLTNYYMGNGTNWNDQASSAWTGAQCVEFWSDIKGSGHKDTFGKYTAFNFPTADIGNDQLSSVTLYSC